MDKKYLVFDIGGTFVKWALIGSDYKIITNSKWPFNGKVEGKTILCQKMNEKVNEIKKDYQIDAIGISTSGTVDPKTQKLVGKSFNIADMDGCDFQKELSLSSNCPIFVENDANAAVLGESVSSKLKDIDNLLMITLGTGIGAGIIINKKLYRGSYGMAGELGNHIYNDQRWEYYHSSIGLERMVEKRNGLKLSTYDILDSKDKQVIETLDLWYEGIAHVLANTIVLMNFEAIVIGGGISESPLFNLSLLDNKIKKYLLQQQFHNTYQLYKASMGNDVALIGMAKVINESGKE